jgi:hypothetical protein
MQETTSAACSMHGRHIDQVHPILRAAYSRHDPRQARHRDGAMIAVLQRTHTCIHARARPRPRLPAPARSPARRHPLCAAIAALSTSEGTPNRMGPVDSHRQTAAVCLYTMLCLHESTRAIHSARRYAERGKAVPACVRCTRLVQHFTAGSVQHSIRSGALADVCARTGVHPLEGDGHRRPGPPAPAASLGCAIDARPP